VTAQTRPHARRPWPTRDTYRPGVALEDEYGAGYGAGHGAAFGLDDLRSRIVRELDRLGRDDDPQDALMRALQTGEIR
jgi:hypothetical protein